MSTSFWQRLLTFVAAAGAGVGAVLLPTAAPVLVPLATALAGWATKHPADSTNASEKPH
jgi:hypothetical protein